MKDKKKFSIPNSTRQKEQKSYKQSYDKLYFQTILQSMGEEILVIDRDLKIQKANRFLLDILKREEKELIGKHCYRLIHKRNSPCLKCQAHETFKNGKPAYASHTGIAKDGSTTYVDLSFYPIFDENGRVIQVIEKAADVSECTQIKSRLKKTYDYLEKLNNALGETIVTVSMPDRKIEYVNNSVEKIFGYKPDECIGKTTLMFYKKDKDYHDFGRKLQRTIKDGKSLLKVEIDLKRKNGEYFSSEIITTFIKENESIVRVISIVRDISDHKQTIKKLIENKKQMDLFSMATSDLFWNWDIVNGTVERSIGFEKVFGYLKKEIVPNIEWWIDRLHPDDRQRVLSTYQNAIDNGSNTCSYEYRFRCHDGSYAIMSDKVYIMSDKNGRHVRSLGAMTDITGRKRVQEETEKMQIQIFHSQKMEIFGQLAGGIAHEFNNILMALMGYGETIQRGMNKNDPLKDKIDRILSLTNRATDFTRSLLTFSRKNAINPKPVKLNEIIENVKKLLSNLLGEDIELTTKLSTKNLIIKADVGQIEQVLMNLATNARDAMPGGGRITIKTGLKEISEKFIKKQGFGKRGCYAFLTFTDTGKGMNKKTLQKVFEPFFTTKDTGKGTGLGLSTVYGISEQHKGFIGVYSKLGEGTTFEIYFPLLQFDKLDSAKNEIISFEGKGTEAILVAEDNEDVRKMIIEQLRQFGYKVVKAVDGEDAVKTFKKKKEEIQLVLLDVIMPKKNGIDAYEEIKKEKPGIKHIFMSGYSKNLLDSKGIVSEEINYIFKPISIFELIRTVRKVLDKK